MQFRKWITIVLAMFAASWAHAQGAESFPNRPVRIIVGFAPGGANDIVTRIVAQKLYEIWGQTVVVDNRGGAGGNIAGELTAKSNPDGYTLFMTSGSIVTANQHLYKRMTYNPDKDLVAITSVASGPQIVVVNPSAPWKTLKDLIAAAKAKPKSITFGSAGFGTQTHLAAENFVYAAGIDVLHIPYKGEAPAMTELLAGQIQFVTANLAAAIGFVTQNKLRGLAVTSKERVRQLPDVPTVAETLPGFENLGWFGLMAPAGTPRPIIDKVQKDTIKAIQSPEVKARFDQIGMYASGNTPEQFAKDIREESKRWEKIIRERKLAID
jgi:tripartite-type tricarboxylate transporter receptor subunit TctC